ncbi:hypothetical protein [Aeromicrobium stalagmiti]|uniref:hypothetical protein n=1 Tax=Aeromicrobium stalagmiti TaxID=2738988 RepID=UPI0015691202|nr:hypothetical protein [Aeromicrobium stalagmiti]NRQ49303.1 hypothetical protein [Aeromicrobium stalagmiti]
MRRRAAVVSIVLMSLLGACGGSDDPAPSDDAAGSASSTDSGDGEVEVLDVCKEISADEVGQVLGATVTSELGPFDACEYDQEDPRATSVAIDAQSLAELGGGFESYRAGTGSVLTDGETVDVPGVGDEAFITTGRFGDGENTQLQGAVSIGGQLISVNLTQASGIAGDVLVGQATELLKLVVSKV